MAQFASSNFNGTEDQELSAFDANWAKQAGSTVDAEISSGRVRSTATTPCLYYYGVAPTSADYSVGVGVHNPGATGNSNFGPVGRAATGSGSGYHARYNTPTGTVQLFRFVNGTFTQLGNVTRAAPTAGTAARLVLTMTGSTIEVEWNDEGTPLISVTDTAITSPGFPALRWNPTSTPSDTSGWQGEDFSADQAGGGGVTQDLTASAQTQAAATAALSVSKPLAGSGPRRQRPRPPSSKA